MKQYGVVRKVEVDGKVYLEGQSIELEQIRGEKFVRAGIVKETAKIESETKRVDKKQ